MDINLLFVHPNFPAQFRHLARHFGRRPERRVAFACRYPNAEEIPGVRKLVYRPTAEPHPKTHRYLKSLASDVFNGQAAWRLCDKLKKEGFKPELICAHPGWGDALFIKDAYPDVPLLSYMEFYYHAFGADAHFDPQESIEPDSVARIRIRNAKHLLNLEACDWAVTPTEWQKRQHPKEFQHKISVIHDGIDTDRIRPGRGNRLTLPDGTILDSSHEIVTYVARNFEPYRGFPQAMRALEIILRERPRAHALMVGEDGVSYGNKPKNGQTWRQAMLDEVDLDRSRVHWLGKLPYDEYLKVVRYSDAHMYLTVPFVLSWSMLEAMAAGCLVVASDTPPVTEVIDDGVNGLLADFFDHAQVARRVSEALDERERMKPIREAARRTVIDRYALRDALPRQIALMESLAQGRNPCAPATPPAPKHPYSNDSVALSASGAPTGNEVARQLRPIQ